eukprot:TRINITY_DN5766_c0_g3_i1.p1 TRINITY_DN5766_c0_g3~~TRINITY_DN5766_c0_g3_i1.p1  ORF type:complete len:417 (+),score=133.57 TRINITY_DN5766_c0_g3_i1:115-1251(+)
MPGADAVTALSDAELQDRLCRVRAELAARKDVAPAGAGEDEFSLALFVLGWGLDVKKAADAVAASRKWRQENAADAAREAVRGGMPPADFPHASKVQAAWPNNLCGEDLPDCRDGMPVATTRLGLADLDGLAEGVGLEGFKQYMTYVMEYRLWVMEQRTRESGGRICRWVDVHDLYCPRGLLQTFSTRNIGLFRWWLSTLAPHYPEQVRKVFVVNVPGAFNGGWRIAKPWLPKRTLEKTAILPTEFGELRQLVDPERLPIHLGSAAGDAAVSLEGPGQGQVSVPRGKDLEMVVPLKSSEAAEWRFSVQSHDVGFHANFHPGSPGTPHTPVSAPGRHAAADGAVNGRFTAGEDGVLALRWDNTFSWTRSKQIDYLVKVA